MIRHELYLLQKEADQKRKKLIAETVKTCDESKIVGLLLLSPKLKDDEKISILQETIRNCGSNIGLIEKIIEHFEINLANIKSLLGLFSSNPDALRHFMAKEELAPLFKKGLKTTYNWNVMRANQGFNEPNPKYQPRLVVMKEFMNRQNIENTTHRNPSVWARMGPRALFSLCNKRALNEALDRLKANPPHISDLHDLFNALVSECKRDDIGVFLGRFIDELSYKPAYVLTSFQAISGNRHALKYLITRPDFKEYMKYHIPSRYKSNIAHMLREGVNISKPAESLPEFEEYQTFMTSQRIPFAQPENYRRDKIAEREKERLISRAERIARDEDRIVTRRLTYDQEQRALSAAKSGREYTRRALEKSREMQADKRVHNRRIDLNLVHAAIKCDIGRVRAALSNGASTTAIIKGTGSIPLAYYITNCRIPLSPGIDFTEDQKEMIEMLMRGVNDDPEILCSLDHLGRSLLELAIVAGNNGMAYILITETDFVNYRPDIAQMIYDHAEGRIINDFGYGTYYGKPISHIISQLLKVKLSYIPEEARRPADIRRVAEAAAKAARRAPAATAVQNAMRAASEAMKELPLEAKVTPESLTVTEYTEPEAKTVPPPSPQVEAAIDATLKEPVTAAASGGSGNVFDGLGLNNAGIDLALLNMPNNTSSAAAAEPKKNDFNALLSRAAAKGITLPARLTKKKYAAKLRNFLNALSENNSNNSSSNNNAVNINTLGGGRRRLKTQKRR